MFPIHPRDKSVVLAIGAHPDDIELGCGGILQRLRSEFRVEIYYAILTCADFNTTPANYNSSKRTDEALRAAAILLDESQRVIQEKGRVTFGGMRDGELSQMGTQLTDFLKAQIQRFTCRSFDLIFTHSSDDGHPDHRSVCDATLSAACDFHGTVLSYQSPSTRPCGFHPNLFVELTAEQMELKDRMLNEHRTQSGKGFMTQRNVRNATRPWVVYHRLYESECEAFRIQYSVWPSVSSQSSIGSTRSSQKGLPKPQSSKTETAPLYIPPDDTSSHSASE